MRALGASRTSLVPGGALAAGWARDPLWKTARAVPSLDLDFAGTKSLKDDISNQDLITFTRASSGTYVGSDGLIKTATTNEARFDHNPTTGESLGLLVEEARTNNLLQSEDFSTTWSVDGSTSIATNTIASPASTLTADTLTVSGGGANRISQSYSVPSAGTYTLTVYAKAGTGNLLQIRQFFTGNDAYAIFNFTTGVMGAVSGGTSASASATPLPNGWYRLVLTNTYSGAATINIRIGGAVGSAETNTTFYIWGAQLEAGASATSYIPTTTATVTRAADVASITGSNFSSFYNASAGTLLVDYRTPASGTRGVADFNDNTANERIALFTSSTDPKMLVVDNGITQADLDGGTIVASTMAKTAVAYTVNDFSIVHAAGTAVTDTSGTLPIVNRLLIGADQAGNYQNGRTKRFTYWPVRLADTTLQQITQP